MVSAHLAISYLLECMKQGGYEYESIYINNADCIYEDAIYEQIFAASLTDESSGLILADPHAFNEESMKVRVESYLSEGHKSYKITEISKQLEDAENIALSIDLYKFSLKALKRLGWIYTAEITAGNTTLFSEAGFNVLFKCQDIAPLFLPKGLKYIEIDDAKDLEVAGQIFTPDKVEAKANRPFKIEQFSCYLVDIDGTLALGYVPINSAISFVNRLLENGKAVYFMTNNTSKSMEAMVAKLERLGVKNVRASQVLTPLMPTINYIKANNLAPVFTLATAEVRSFLAKYIKLTSNGEIAKCALLTYDTELKYSELASFCELLQVRPLPYLATHIDEVCPTKTGFIPDIGSFIAMIKRATSRVPNLTFGKPSPLMLDVPLGRFKKEEIVLIGDRLYTDGALARAANISFILTLTGESSEADLDESGQHGLAAKVVKDLCELLD